jgi:hypothetical protein
MLTQLALQRRSEPGWYTDPDNPEVMLWWDGQQWKDANGILPPPDNWFLHFLAFAVGLAVLVFAIGLFVLCAAALPFALRKTGRRARDSFMLFIPIWGAVLLIETVWRLTARRMCWLPRRDLPSKPLFGPAILPKDMIPHQARIAMGL